jgi:hypothetical protein
MSIDHRAQLAYCRAKLDEKNAAIIALAEQRDALEREGAQMRRHIRELEVLLRIEPLEATP